MREEGRGARSGVTSSRRQETSQQGGAPLWHPGVTTSTADLIPDPARYQVDDLIIELAPRRVWRAGTVIRLQALSFDLLVTLVRAAPGLVNFEQLGERVWPGLVVTPETIVQRVKLLRSALGDDAHAPRYIEGVRGHGYRMLADVRPLTQAEGIRQFTVQPSPNGHATTAITGLAAANALSATGATAHRNGVPLGGIAGTLAIGALLAASWATLHYRGTSRSVGQDGSGAGPVAIHSLAVLPLENLSGDKEQEYFADGMTDALTTDLAQIGSLRVISRTSAMHFKDTTKTLPQIGHELRVDAVVEGTVERGDNRVRVTAQLVDASTDRHLWARTYERDLKDVLALQDEIARDITDQIRVKLSPEERRLLMQVHAVDPEAYDDYLRGWYWCNSPTTGESDPRKAQYYYRKAITKDPNYALAYAGLAETYFGMSYPRPAGDDAAKGRQAVAKALSLDPSLAEAHAVLAFSSFFLDWNWSAAEAGFKRATTLNPNNANAHYLYSVYLVTMARLGEALNEVERAQDLDPLSATYTEWRGQVLYHLRRYDDALREMRRGLEMYPDNAQLYWDTADVYEQKQMFPEAFNARQRSLSLQKNPNVTALAEAYRRSGYRGYLLKQARVLEHTMHPAYLGHLYVRLGDDSRAMTTLETSYENHDAYVLFVRTAPELDSIRALPRFRALVRRIGFPSSPN